MRNPIVRKLMLFGCIVVGLCGCNNHAPSAEEAVEALVNTMTLEQKVGQLFVVRPEYVATYGAPKGAVTALTAELQQLYTTYPVGGVCLFAENVVSPRQLTALTRGLHSLPSPPLVCIDEEGGRVARIARNSAFDVPRYRSMADVAKEHSAEKVRGVGEQIGLYLARYGIDVDFAPVADVNTNPQNRVIGDRAFSPNPEVAAPMVVAFMEGLHNEGVTACIKHFPGHGDTYADSHEGYATTPKTLSQMRQCELLPFRKAIEAGAQMIMTAHISAPEVLGDMTPATLSPLMVEGLLREEMGFEGVIITDGMEMGAIAAHYNSAEAAVRALEAGVDMLLLPEDFVEAYEGVLSAVRSGRLTEERIDQSLRRILLLKYHHGLF